MNSRKIQRQTRKFYKGLLIKVKEVRKGVEEKVQKRNS